MKKAILVAVLAFTGFGVSSCSTQQGSQKEGYDSSACRSKCQRLGQHVSVTASADAGRCICTNDSTSEA